jgi:hypothetical protein
MRLRLEALENAVFRPCGWDACVDGLEEIPEE